MSEFREYRIKTAVTLRSGLVGLDSRQVATRRAYLQDTDEPGVYLVLAPIQFKAGEIIGLRPAELPQVCELIEEVG